MENKELEVEETVADETTATTNTETATDETAEATAQTDSKTEALEAQVTELKDKFTRLVAEFDNYKKRTNRERLDLLDTAAKDTILAFLPISDDLARATKANETATDIAIVTEGVNLIHQRFTKTLTQCGIRPIAANGADFDAEFHEAVAELPMGDAMKGKVIDTVESGFFLNDKIIRFAKVVVGK